MAKILIADDEPEIRKAIVHMVTEGGYEALETSDGLGALFDLKDHKPDLLLLDWMIPEIMGGDVLDKLRHDPEYAAVAETPVIVVSDFVDESSRAKFMSAGANDFVAKRDDLDAMRRELLASIERLLSETK